MSMDDIVRKNLAQQKREEAKLFKELKASYRDVERSLMREADKVLAGIEKQPNLIYHQERVDALLRQVRGEMQKYADDYVVPIVERGMVQSSYLGNQQATDALRSIYGEVIEAHVLPTHAIESFTRHVTTGPLGRLFDSFGDDAAAKARSSLLRSIALGHNPRKSASELRKVLGVSRNRALLITRTETMRAHREGARATYQRNGVQTWVWHAAASARTCAACWALHGKEFDIQEKMAAHPACRCSMVPKPQTWRELGYTIDGDSVIEDGETLFASQPASVQQKVLGSQYQRYKQGDIKLDDFLSVKQSPYGKTYTKRVPK